MGVSILISIANEKEVLSPMPRFTPPRSKNRDHNLSLKTLVPALLFILAICLTLKTTYYATEHYLDGDASSELVLANHLAETGQVLSSDWYYSTELRVLNTQLVYAPLFRIFSDWHMVRFVGALIMQALLVFSFAYLCKQTSLSLGAFFLGAALLISPTSIAYGRIVLYHCYYMPHIILSFLIVGLYLSACSRYRQQQMFPFIIRFVLLILISFMSGLGGIRQLVITHAPLCLLPVFLFFYSALNTPVPSTFSEKRAYFIPAFGAASFAVIGYIVNTSILSGQFDFSHQTGITYRIIDSDKISTLFYSIVNLFGFQDSSSLFTVAGIASLGGVCIAAYCIFCSLHRLLHSDCAAAKFPASIISLFGISAFCILLAIFMIADSEWLTGYIRFLIPSVVWFIPFLCVQYDDACLSLSVLKVSDALLLSVLMCFIPDIATNTRFFLPHPDSYILRYEGLYNNDKLVQQLENCIQPIYDQGFSQGYSTFWNANTLTEMTDGQIKMIGLTLNKDEDTNDHEAAPPSFSYLKWLTLKSYLDLEPEKVFLLLTSAENEAYLEMPFEDKGEVIYEDDGHFIVYGFDDPSALYQMIAW